MLPRFLTIFAISAFATLTVVSLWMSREAPASPTPTQTLVAEKAPAPVPAWTRLCGSNADTDLDRLIEQVAADYDIEPAMLATLATKESTCRPDAIGGAGEIGLTQVHPKVWTKNLTEKGLISAPSDLLDPETNLRCSAYIIRGHLKTDGDVWKAFRRYNGSGPKARRYANDAHRIYKTLSN